MYPTLLRIGGFEITSFGAMVAIGALAGLWILRRELAHDRLPESALDAAIFGVFGGMAGAKLLWVIEHSAEAPFLDLLLSRGGMSWFGGFAGGVGAAIAVLLYRRLPVLPVIAAATPALAIGHAIGRVGCLLVGDDYGRPTTVPWGIAFPQGLPPTDVPVHPTQIYEALALLPLAWILVRMRRHGAPPARVLGAYLALAGTIRFAIEWLRVDVRVLGPLSVAHIASAAVALVGVLLLLAPRPGRSGSSSEPSPAD